MYHLKSTSFSSDEFSLFMMNLFKSSIEMYVEFLIFGDEHVFKVMSMSFSSNGLHLFVRNFRKYWMYFVCDESIFHFNEYVFFLFHDPGIINENHFF